MARLCVFLKRNILINYKTKTFKNVVLNELRKWEKKLNLHTQAPISFKLTGFVNKYIPLQLSCRNWKFTDWHADGIILK